MIDSNNDLLQAIDRYRALLDRKDELSELTTENNKAIIDARDALAEMMLQAETPKITRNGYGYTVTAKSKFSRAPGVTEAELIEAFRLNGYGDLVKETIPAQTVQKTVKDLTEENDDQIPEEFGDVITRYDYYDVLRRKATK